MNEHVRNVHGPNRQTREPKEKVQYCHFWNNYGSCNYEDKNGRPCKFAHTSAPKCYFDGECSRKRCMFSHQKQNVAFLAAQMKRTSQTQWLHSNSSGKPVWANQSQIPQQRFQQSKWGNQSQFQ